MLAAAYAFAFKKKTAACFVAYQPPPLHFFFARWAYALFFDFKQLYPFLDILIDF